MPLTTLSGTIAANKSARPGYASLMLCKITLIDGTVIYLSTSLNNDSLASLDYGGNHYLCRILDQSSLTVQARSQSGIDLIPTASLTIADADRFLRTNYELPPNAGFKGGTIQLSIVLWQAGTTNFSSDSSPRFTGILQRPHWDNDKLILNSYAVKNPQNIYLPTDRVTALCQNIFPSTYAQRQSGQPQSASDSWYWRCGYSPDVSGSDSRGNLVGGVAATTCNLTKADCQAKGMYSADSSSRVTARFSGTQWNPPLSFSSVSYVTGSTIKGYNSSDNAKYNQRYPYGIGTGWVDPVLMNSINDGNSQRGEFVVCSGYIGSNPSPAIIQVLVNDNTVPVNYGSPADKLFRVDQVTSGDRSGHVNQDAGYSGQGDPYGGLACLEYVVPTQLVSSQSTPRLRVLLKFPGIRYYSSPTSYSIVQYDSLRPLTPGTAYTADGGVNPAWGIMDILVNGNYEYADLDIATFVTAAAYCDTLINHTDITGETYQHCRYSMSLILPGTQNARDMGSIIANALRSFNASLSPNPLTGLLQMFVRGTLADNQPSPITGSNYSTAVSSNTADGTAANGYIAWHFNESNILALGNPPNLTPSIKQLPPLGSEVATTIAVPFQDAENQWVDDSYTVVDTAALPYTAQQQISSNNFQAEGATTFDQIGRVVRTYFYEQTRGNFSADPRGTMVYQLQTTYETNHLVVGNIVWLTYHRDGIVQQMFRVSKIDYSKDARVITYEISFHSDSWYFDNNTTLVPPVYSLPGNSNDLSSVLPWKPGGNYQLCPSLPSGFSKASFHISLSYTGVDLNGNYTPTVTIRGYPPINSFGQYVQPPRVPLYATTSSTGGYIPPGTYVLALAALDITDSSNPLTSALSNLIQITIPAGTNTNTVSIPRVYWPSSTVSTGYAVYMGTEEQTLYLQSTTLSTPPSTVSLSSYHTNATGPPDYNFSCFRVQAAVARHLGVWALPCLSYSSGTITFLASGDSRSFTANQYSSPNQYIITRLCSGSDSTSPPTTEPFGSWLVTSNDAVSVTISADTLASTIQPGDVFVMRAFTSTHSSNTIGDPQMINSVYPTDSDETGNIVWILYGTGAGQRRTIRSNSSGVYTVSKPWDTVPDSTSVFVVVQQSFPYDQLGNTLSVSENTPDATTGLPPIVDRIDFSNYLNSQVVIRVVTEDAQGNFGIDSLSPFREYYIQGKMSPSNVSTIQITY